jgi:hypothetical protein
MRGIVEALAYQAVLIAIRSILAGRYGRGLAPDIRVYGGES